MEPSDIAAAAVAIGPGSYTGLRIGLGFAKGLALANQTKLIGVQTLDIVAAAQPFAEQPLVVIAEAGRRRVCAGRYSWHGSKGWQQDGQADIFEWPDLLDALGERTIFTGEVSPAGAKLIRAAKMRHVITKTPDAVRRAGYLAEIGWQRLRRGWTDDPASLAPIYLRDPAGARP
jgi:tRNA threonylcarbamoyladenosine biosynthesis protein TsaB